MSTESGHSVLHALHSRQRSSTSWSPWSPNAPCGSGDDSACTSACARPRVEWRSSRVAMNDGHIVRPASSDFRHAPILAHRFAAPRIPPTASNEKCVATGSARGSDGSRRFSVMRGASTFLPGFKRPVGSNSCFSERIVSYSSSPKIRRLNSLRTSPSPCSLLFIPPNDVTSPQTSSAMARSVATPPGLVMSMNGRMWRHPADACP